MSDDVDAHVLAMVWVDWVLLKNSRKDVTVTLNSEKCWSFLKITCKAKGGFGDKWKGWFSLWGSPRLPSTPGSLWCKQLRLVGRWRSSGWRRMGWREVSRCSRSLKGQERSGGIVQRWLCSPIQEEGTQPQSALPHRTARRPRPPWVFVKCFGLTPIHTHPPYQWRRLSSSLINDHEGKSPQQPKFLDLQEVPQWRQTHKPRAKARSRILPANLLDPPDHQDADHLLRRHNLHLDTAVVRLKPGVRGKVCVRVGAPVRPHRVRGCRAEEWCQPTRFAKLVKFVQKFCHLLESGINNIFDMYANHCGWPVGAHIASSPNVACSNTSKNLKILKWHQPW